MAMVIVRRDECEDEEDQEPILPGTCGRCGKSKTEGPCKVPHPAHLCIDMGGLLTGSKEGITKNVQCGACGEYITYVVRNYSSLAPSNIIKIQRGPKFCFTGKHRSSRVPLGDERRINPGHVLIGEGEDMQPSIDNYLRPENQSNVKILTLMGSGEATIPVSLKHNISNLTRLKIINTPVSKLHLNTELTPRLTHLELENVQSECDFKVTVPTLKKISLSFLQIEYEGDVINEMLSAATNLIKFESYKLWDPSQLWFASNKLKNITLQRSDCLQAISIWAPNLERLDLTCCYDLEAVEILKKHPTLSKELPAGHKPSRFIANCQGSIINKTVRTALEKSGRCVIIGAEPEPDDC